MSSPKNKEVEVLAFQRRRRWNAGKKRAMVREAYESGMSVSLVARKHGVNPNQIFHWRRLERDGALTAVGASRGFFNGLLEVHGGETAALGSLFAPRELEPQQL